MPRLAGTKSLAAEAPAPIVRAGWLLSGPSGHDHEYRFDLILLPMPLSSTHLGYVVFVSGADA